MNKMNKVIAIILLLFVILQTCISCVGIGDGALIGGERSLGTEEKMEESAVAYETRLISIGDVTFPAYVIEPSDDVPFLGSETKCTFTMCGFTGEERAKLDFEDAEAYNFYKMVFQSKRDLDKEIDKSDKLNYIDIDFYYDTDGGIIEQGRFRIYSNDYIDVTEQGVSTMVSSRILSGYTEGIYQALISYASQAIKPYSVTIRPIVGLSASIPANAVLGADEAAEIYKLLMSAEPVAMEENGKGPVSAGYILVSFEADCGIAQFHVRTDGVIEQSHGFLQGNAVFYPRYSEGVYQKILNYYN